MGGRKVGQGGVVELSGKNEIRKKMLALRDSIDPARRIEMSLAIADAAGGIEFEPGAVISGYLPIRSEPDLRPLMARLRARGARLCLPVILDRQRIVFREFMPGGELVNCGFGTLGPAVEAAVLEPDLLLMPLAAYDSHGNRLGYGAGHYDRAIARLRAGGRDPRLIGTAFDIQRADRLPSEPHDIAMERILTESGLRSFAEHL